MAYKYFPHTPEDLKDMLQKSGVESLDDLYADIPEQVRYKGPYGLADGKSEIEVMKYFDDLGKKNRQLTCFAGAGAYDRYVPAVVPSIVSRSEYLTSYTPYQAEISQGTLHYIFEYQSMMAELTGMDISNASLYDGSTATAEAMLMANANSKKSNTVLVSETLDPKVLDVVRTYAHFHGVQIEMVPEKDGITDREALEQQLQAKPVAGLIMQQPNYYGNVEDFTGIADLCHQQKALFVLNSNPFDLALLKTPGEWGADIAVGEVQSLGIPMSWGGPYIGYMCVTEKLMRKMPGRIVGKTLDQDGQRAFVLTLQAREQHIRRQKATSNICSNESLLVLWSTIYMSIMGKEGLKEAAQRSYDGAHYMQEQLVKAGFKPTFSQPFFNEFCVDYDGDLDALLKRLEDRGIFGGIKVGDHTLMIAVSEKRSREEIDEYISICNE